MASLQIFVVLLLTAGVIGVALWAAVVNSGKAAANLRGMAQRLGLDYTESKAAGVVTQHEVAGLLAGRAVRFYSYSTGAGKTRTVWRAVLVRPRSGTGGLNFNLHRQGLGSKIEAMFGATEAVTGDAEFDAAWFLRTNQPGFLSAALVPEVRAKLMAARKNGATGSFTLEQGLVRYAETGGFAAAAACARLEAMIPVLQDLADIAEVAGGSKQA